MPENRSLVRIHIGAADRFGWISGESFSDYVGRTATYSDSSVAVDPFRTIGEIRSGFGLASATMPGIQAQIVALERYTPRARVMYGFDIKSSVYYIDTLNHNASIIQSLNASTITNLSSGFKIHRDALYAAYNVNATLAYLSRYSPLSGTPAWNVSFNVSLLAFAPGTAANGVPTEIKQVLLSWKGNLYAFHGNLIWYTAGTSGALTGGATLPDDKIVKTAVGFGNQIAIGASDNIVDSTFRGDAKVYFYDGFSQDWQKEIPFPENDITNLEFDGHDLYAYGPNGKYVYDGVGFEKIDDLETSVPHGGTDVRDRMVYFGGSPAVRAYGAPRQGLEKALIRPSAGIAANAIIRWVTNSVFYVADQDGNIKSFSSSSAETGAVLVTRFIEAPDGPRFYVRAIRVSYASLASVQTMTIYLIDDNGTTWTVGTITFAADGTAFPNSKEFQENGFTDPLPITQKCQVKIAFDGGSPRVNSIDLLIETSKEI